MLLVVGGLLYWLNKRAWIYKFVRVQEDGTPDHLQMESFGWPLTWLQLVDQRHETTREIYQISDGSFTGYLIDIAVCIIILFIVAYFAEKRADLRPKSGY